MTKGGGGGQKSQKNDDVFYERPQTQKFSFFSCVKTILKQAIHIYFSYTVQLDKYSKTPILEYIFWYWKIGVLLYLDSYSYLHLDSFSIL